MNNGKKEYAEHTLEYDANSKKARKILPFFKNQKGLLRFVKRKINKRHRKSGKKSIDEQVSELWEHEFFIFRGGRPENPSLAREIVYF